MYVFKRIFRFHHKHTTCMLLHLYTNCRICIYKLPDSWNDSQCFFFQQGIVCSRSDVSLLLSQSHERIASAKRSVAKLVSFLLDLVTFQTNSPVNLSYHEATSEKSSDFFWSLGGCLALTPRQFRDKVVWKYAPSTPVHVLNKQRAAAGPPQTQNTPSVSLCVAMRRCQSISRFTTLGDCERNRTCSSWLHKAQSFE